MTFEEFSDLVNLSPKPEHLRPGQYAWGMLHTHNLDLGIQIMQMRDVDPFYDDECLPAFWDWLKENWDNKIVK